MALNNAHGKRVVAVVKQRPFLFNTQTDKMSVGVWCTINVVKDLDPESR